MEKSKVDQLLMMCSSKVPATAIPTLRDKLMACEDEANAMVMISDMKDPTIALVLSIVVGIYGVDRFYIGDTGLGVGKLLTCGGAWVWWLIDLFLIMDATRNKNMEKLMYL